MQTFCTIITADYLPFAKVLFASLKKINKSSSLQVLVINNIELLSTDSFNIHHLKDLSEQNLFKEIEKKYAHTNDDHFRWALKPIFITYLLKKGFEKVIFLDPDVFFVGKYDFLFDHLNHSSVLLTPHWSNIEAEDLENSLIYLMRNGLFNAGFVGVSQKGIPAMQWWAEACHFKIDRQKELGIFVDQKYLDILPIEFPETVILQHRGCNIACWNMNSNKRTLVNGKLLINNMYDPIFLHLTKDTIRHILNGNDYKLKPFLTEYENLFKSQGIDLQSYLPNVDLKSRFTLFNYLKRKSLLRTKLKKILLRLSQKI